MKVLFTLLFVVVTSVYADSGFLETSGQSIVTIAQPSIQTYFSPKGGCSDALCAAISTAKTTLDVAIYSITDIKVANAILDAKMKGVKVRMVCDKTQSKGLNSKVDYLVANGIVCHIIRGTGGGIMHIKMAIIDNAYIIFGSYNFTEHANLKNDEIMVGTNDQGLIKAAKEHFTVLWKH